MTKIMRYILSLLSVTCYGGENSSNSIGKYNTSYNVTEHVKENIDQKNGKVYSEPKKNTDTSISINWLTKASLPVKKINTKTSLVNKTMTEDMKAKTSVSESVTKKEPKTVTEPTREFELAKTSFVGKKYIDELFTDEELSTINSDNGLITEYEIPKVEIMPLLGTMPMQNMDIKRWVEICYIKAKILDTLSNEIASIESHCDFRYDDAEIIIIYEEVDHITDVKYSVLINVDSISNLIKSVSFAVTSSTQMDNTDFALLEINNVSVDVKELFKDGTTMKLGYITSEMLDHSFSKEALVLSKKLEFKYGHIRNSTDEMSFSYVIVKNKIIEKILETFSF